VAVVGIAVGAYMHFKHKREAQAQTLIKDASDHGFDESDQQQL
jgi:hypothetical protein